MSPSESAAPAEANSTTPQPQRFEVLGGTKEGGIIVREGQKTTSAKLPERLATGALIEQLQLEGERLRYRKLWGAGPATGWVSCKASSKQIVRPTSKHVPEPATEEAQFAGGARQGNTGDSPAVEVEKKPPANEANKALTFEQALALQEELIEGFGRPDFERELAALFDAHPSRNVDFKRKQAKLYFSVQSAVLPKYGFEATQSGILKMMQALNTHRGPKVTQNDERLNKLLIRDERS